MYELKKNGKVFTSKSVGTGPSAYEKRIYRAAVSQTLRNTYIEDMRRKGSREQCKNTEMSNSSYSVLLRKLALVFVQSVHLEILKSRSHMLHFPGKKMSSLILRI